MEIIHYFPQTPTSAVANKHFNCNIVIANSSQITSGNESAFSTLSLQFSILLHFIAVPHCRLISTSVLETHHLTIFLYGPKDTI